MKKLLLSFILLGFVSCSSDTPNACLMSEAFIKKELNFPKEASFPFLDCNTTDNGDGTYTILRKISAKNAFGMETEYIYKVKMSYNGGVTTDQDSWQLLDIQSEEVQ